jgi:hypothetical protein
MQPYLENIIKINTESSNLLAGNLDLHLHKKFNAFSMQFFSLNILHRIVFYQRSLNPLLKELDANTAFEFPIALLLRAACMDILQYGYMMQCLDSLPLEKTTTGSFQKDIQPKIVESLQSIYCGNLKNQIYDWKCLKEKGVIQEVDLDLLVKTLNQKFFSYFPDESPTKCKSLSAREIFKQLKEDSKYDVFSDAFFYYSYYSKFEHFGILSYEYSKPAVQGCEDPLSKILHISAILLKVSQIGLSFLMSGEEVNSKYDNWIDGLLIN